MSSSGPGSVLVFLTFVIASALLVSIYATAYVGLLSAAGGAAQQAEAAAEQAVIYLFGDPRNATAEGIQGETRIAIHNVGRGELLYDRILAIGTRGEILAEAVQPRDRGLGPAQWLLYRPSELGLPERWDNFTTFRAEVGRLVLLSARGRSHGSMWGVPPFLESLYESTITQTLTTTYTYRYETPTTMTTTYTITINAPPRNLSVMGEIWVSDNGRTWGRVGRGWDLYSGPITACGVDTFCDWKWWEPNCGGSAYGRRWLNNKCYGGGCLTRAGPPRIEGSTIMESEGGERILYRIFYVGYGRNVTAAAGRGFAQYGESKECLYDSAIGQWYWRIRQWGKSFAHQAIELVDWDTGEVYASTNSSSLTFQVSRNTIVRFKYVKTESWSREWIIVPPPPAPPAPEDCAERINSLLPGSPSWCECARVLGLPEYDQYCPGPEREYCLTVSFRPCCVGAPTYNDCLESWSAEARPNCKRLAQGQTATVEVTWSASWRLKPGWYLSAVRTVPEGPHCRITGGTHDSVRGYCRATLPPSTHYDIVVLFRRTS